MATQWRFDTNNPYEDSFDEALLRALDSPDIFNVVKRKLLDIQNDPKAGTHGMVRGRVVYIAFTGPGLSFAGLTVEPLLIVYTLQEREKLIQRVFVCKASEYVQDPVGGALEAMPSALRGAIARAMANAGSPKVH